MNRRIFVVQASAGLLLGCIRPALRLDSQGRELICIPDVLGPLGEVPDTLAILGREYLLGHRDENDGEKLLDAVFGPLDENGLDGLRDTIAADHAAGDVVTVEGWRLARTEARLAALVFLSEQC